VAADDEILWRNPFAAILERRPSPGRPGGLFPQGSPKENPLLLPREQKNRPAVKVIAGLLFTIGRNHCSFDLVRKLFNYERCRTVVVTVSLRTYLPVQQPVYSHQFHQWHPRSEHREQELHQPSSTSEEPHCAQWERGHHP